MEIILDADVLIGGEKGTFDLQTWVRSRTQDQFGVAAITIAELLHGVARASGTRKLKRRQYVQSILDAVPVFPYTEQTAKQHARIGPSWNRPPG